MLLFVYFVMYKIDQYKNTAFTELLKINVKSHSNNAVSWNRPRGEKKQTNKNTHMFDLIF